jgi:glycosyltransferase involved in cell wall biosynthesis
MKKLAIVTTHPIQYNAPLFRLINESRLVKCKVFYTWEQSSRGPKYDPDFGRDIEWNIPLLEGYDYTFVRNIAAKPGSHHFMGIVNPSLNKEIEEWKPDAVLVFGWSFQSHLACLRYFHGRLPVLFRGDSTLLDERLGVRRLARRLFLRWVFRHIDYALYTGCNNQAYFLLHGVRPDQLVFAPHAVDNQRFENPDAEYRQQAGEARAELGIAPDDLVLLFAGKLEAKKNPFFLLEIAKQVVDPRLKILFIGSGALEQELRRAAAGDARISVLEFQNQSRMPVVYRIGDIFVLPSPGPGETWGLAANEAMASGCALILSDKTGGAVDLIREGENGIIVGTEEWEKAGRFVEMLLKDRARLAAMKKASRSHIHNFSYQQIVDAIAKTIAQAGTR